MTRNTLTAAIALALSGCASITDGTNQTLIVSLSPREARCTVFRDSVELGSITGAQETITVSKGAKDILISCSAPGYEPRTQRLVSSTQTAGMMSVLFIDLGITDMITGAMWKYPSNTSIALERTPGSPQAQAAAALPYIPVPANIVQLPAHSVAPPGAAIGQDSYTAERIARQANCGDVGPAVLVGKGPGYESYSIKCAGGETLALRCEFGSCRVLK